MSFLERMLPCSCRTWRCRMFYAARVLGALAIVAAIGADLFTAAKSGLI